MMLQEKMEWGNYTQNKLEIIPIDNEMMENHLY